VNASHHRRRFTAFFGKYLSLDYLSFSDVVVLEHIAPFLIGYSGGIFLAERLSSKQICAGCKHSP